MDSRRCLTWQEEFDCFVEHMKKLQSDPFLCRSRFVVQIEKNMTFQSDFFYREMKKFVDAGELQSMIFMTEPSKKGGPERIGTLTTNSTKHQQTIIMMSAVSNSHLAFYDNMITTRDDDVMLQKSILFDQMEHYSSRGTGKGKRVYSGKWSGSKQDDLIMTLGMAMLYHRVFFEDASLYQRHWYHDPDL